MGTAPSRNSRHLSPFELVPNGNDSSPRLGCQHQATASSGCAAGAPGERPAVLQFRAEKLSRWGRWQVRPFELRLATLTLAYESRRGWKAADLTQVFRADTPTPRTITLFFRGSGATDSIQAHVRLLRRSRCSVVASDSRVGPLDIVYSLKWAAGLLIDDGGAVPAALRGVLPSLSPASPTVPPEDATPGLSEGGQRTPTGSGMGAAATPSGVMPPLGSSPRTPRALLWMRELLTLDNSLDVAVLCGEHICARVPAGARDAATIARLLTQPSCTREDLHRCLHGVSYCLKAAAAALQLCHELQVPVVGCGVLLACVEAVRDVALELPQHHAIRGCSPTLVNRAQYRCLRLVELAADLHQRCVAWGWADACSLMLEGSAAQRGLDREPVIGGDSDSDAEGETGDSLGAGAGGGRARWRSSQRLRARQTRPRASTTRPHRRQVGPGSCRSVAARARIQDAATTLLTVRAMWQQDLLAAADARVKAAALADLAALQRELALTPSAAPRRASTVVPQPVGAAPAVELRLVRVMKAEAEVAANEGISAALLTDLWDRVLLPRWRAFCDSAVGLLRAVALLPGGLATAAALCDGARVPAAMGAGARLPVESCAEVLRAAAACRALVAKHDARLRTVQSRGRGRTTTTTRSVRPTASSTAGGLSGSAATPDRSAFAFGSGLTPTGAPIPSVGSPQRELDHCDGPSLRGLQAAADATAELIHVSEGALVQWAVQDVNAAFADIFCKTWEDSPGEVVRSTCARVHDRLRRLHLHLPRPLPASHCQHIAYLCWVYVVSSYVTRLVSPTQVLSIAGVGFAKGLHNRPNSWVLPWSRYHVTPGRQAALQRDCEHLRGWAADMAGVVSLQSGKRMFPTRGPDGLALLAAPLAFVEGVVRAHSLTDIEAHFQQALAKMCVRSAVPSPPAGGSEAAEFDARPMCALVAALRALLFHSRIDLKGSAPGGRHKVFATCTRAVAHTLSAIDPSSSAAAVAGSGLPPASRRLPGAAASNGEVDDGIPPTSGAGASRTGISTAHRLSPGAKAALHAVSGTCLSSLAANSSGTCISIQIQPLAREESARTVHVQCPPLHPLVLSASAATSALWWPSNLHCTLLLLAVTPAETSRIAQAFAALA